MGWGGEHVYSYFFNPTYLFLLALWFKQQKIEWSKVSVDGAEFSHNCWWLTADTSSPSDEDDTFNRRASPILGACSACSSESLLYNCLGNVRMRSALSYVSLVLTDFRAAVGMLEAKHVSKRSCGWGLKVFLHSGHYAGLGWRGGTSQLSHLVQGMAKELKETRGWVTLTEVSCLGKHKVSQ